MKKSVRAVSTGVEILIAEDSPTQAELLKHLLTEHGYSVTVTANGKEAFAAALQHKPTVIITDVVMPVMDGYTLCKEIKSQAKLKDTSVILLTSLSSPQDVIKGLQCGADNFVRKPFNEEYLLSRIDQVLTNQELRKTNRIRIGVEISFGGQRHFITSERQQILDLLISTYEDAVRLNQELQAKQEELARSFESLNGLYRIAEGLNKASSEQEALKKALEGAMELPGVKAGWVSLREGEVGFRLACAIGLPAALQTPGAMDGDCLCRRNLLAGELDGVTNILECERLQKAKGDTRGLRCHASIPLWSGNRTVGILNLVGTDQGLFSDEDLKILYGVGNQIVIAIERAQLLEGLERKVEERTTALTAEVTERQQAEAALRESEERYRFLFETNPLPMWIYDTETLSFMAVNDSAIARYGYSREEFLGMTIKDIRPSEDAPDLLKDVSKTPSVLSETRVWRHRKKDGSIIDVEITSHALPFGKGKTRLVLANDVTARRHLEEQLRQSQKMEAIGQLAGGVAHDFNNLLTVILGYGQLLSGRLGPNDPLSGSVTEILRAGDRAAALTRQLLAFSRRQVLAPQVLDLNGVIANTDRMLRRLIGEIIDLVTVPGTELGAVKADPGQIEQVIVNLAINARDAMPQGGKLTIETANVKLDEAYAAGHAEILPGRFVMLAVSDTGVGMDVETQKRIFEPFFTTKEKGKGTGLGLSTVYGIVKQSGGQVWVYSELGHGSTFKVYLPRVDEPIEKVWHVKAEAERPRGTETILLVEDDASVRSLVRATLESNGYHVIETTNGGEALLVPQQRTGNIHLLLTDLVMPGVSGRVLAVQMVALQPELKVLFMSGYTDDAVVRNGGLEVGMAFIQKPFTPDALARKVREVLDESRGPL